MMKSRRKITELKRIINGFEKRELMDTFQSEIICVWGCMHAGSQ